VRRELEDIQLRLDWHLARQYDKPKSLGLSSMPSNRDRGSSHLLSPPTPPDKRVRIRRFDELLPCRTARRPEVQRTHRRWWFRRWSSSVAGFTRSQLAQAQPEGRLAGAWPRMRRAFLLLLLIVQAFVPRGTTMPSADFCCTVRVNCSTPVPIPERATDLPR